MYYEIGACKNCGKITGITKDKKCDECGAVWESVPLYTWFHQNYSLTEDQDVIEKQDEMDNTEVKASHLSGAELKAGLRDLFICIGGSIALALFGLLLIKGAGGSVKGRMSFMGLLCWCAAAFLPFIGFYLFFKRFASTRAKTPEKAFKIFWETVFEKKTFSDDYEDAEIAVNKITRSLPAAVRQTVDHQKMLSWVNGMRAMVADSNGELAQKSAGVFGEKLYDAKGDSDSLDVENVKNEPVDEHKAVVSAELFVVRKWSRSVQGRNDTNTYAYRMAACVLYPKTTLLKAGKYWYVPDRMPAAEKGELIDGLDKSDPKIG